MADPVKVEFPGQDADCEIEPLDDGCVRVAFRFEVCQLTTKVAGTDAMALGRELMRAATHAAAVARKPEEGANP